MSVVMRRARPLLGTLVEMRVEGVGEIDALRAINDAFAEVELIHRRMSFHETGSDLARVHRAPVGTRVGVDVRTQEVLAGALKVAAASDGTFDPTIAGEQVARGYLPRPDSPFAADPNACWRDIELSGEAIRLHRPLWIDLGGIAKGYAVDRAIEVLRDAGAAQVCVNAGGDLRIAGVRSERVHVRDGCGGSVAAVELADAAIASSTSSQSGGFATHVHGGKRHVITGGATVSVVARTCMFADALTKVVLAQGHASTRVLAAFQAQACVHDAPGWRQIVEAA